jgi:hypothetical protein
MADTDRSFLLPTKNAAMLAPTLPSPAHIWQAALSADRKVIKTDYVYVMQFEDGRIAQVWNSGMPPKSLVGPGRNSAYGSLAELA